MDEKHDEGGTPRNGKQWKLRIRDETDKLTRTRRHEWVAGGAQGVCIAKPVWKVLQIGHRKERANVAEKCK